MVQNMRFDSSQKLWSSTHMKQRVPESTARPLLFPAGKKFGDREPGGRALL